MVLKKKPTKKNIFVEMDNRATFPLRVSGSVQDGSAPNTEPWLSLVPEPGRVRNPAYSLLRWTFPASLTDNERVGVSVDG